MGRAGKHFPNNCRQDYRDGLTVDEFNGPARNCWMTIGSNPQGALMAKWVGVSILSELYEQVGTQLHWRMPHPSITTDDPHFLIAWTVVFNGAAPPNERYVVRLRFSYHEAGTEWGFYNLVAGAWNFVLSSGGTVLFIPGTWTFTTFAQFRNGGSTTEQSIRRATWAENPDFHPYRTRP